mmetsp:Transcript_46869/g.109729  ORF Transcript_46869/g.109729 Transcript_46869/m.109729 type:complete len:370 (-) Transcript_46869:38-1147(-)
MIKSSKPASFSSGVMLSRSEAQRQKGDELRMRAAGIDPTKVDEQWAGEVMSRRQKKEVKVDEEQEKEKKEAADLPMEKSEVVSKRPDGRLRWLHKALVLASKGRIAAPAIYDIVQSSKFTSGVRAKVGMQMKGMMLANLHLFKKEQQKSLQNGRLMDFSAEGSSDSEDDKKKRKKRKSSASTSESRASPKKRKKDRPDHDDHRDKAEENGKKKSKKEKVKEPHGHLDKSEVVGKTPSSRLRWLHEVLVEALKGQRDPTEICDVVRSSKFSAGLDAEVGLRTKGLVLANLHLFEEDDRVALQHCRLMGVDADGEETSSEEEVRESKRHKEHESESYSRSPTPKKKRKKDKSDDEKHREKEKDHKSSKKKH